MQGTRTVKYSLELTETEFNDLLMSVEVTLGAGGGFQPQKERLRQMADEMRHLREGGVPF